MRLSHLVAVLGSFALAACSCEPDPRYLDGTVTDVFGEPIIDATVLAEGWENRAISDASGVYKLEVMQVGAIKLVAGAEGYIKDFATTTVDPDPEHAIAPVEFALWKRPDEVGLYAMGRGEMLALEGAKVTAFGSDINEMHGVREPGDDQVPKDQDALFLYSSTLRTSEITQLDLKLFKLKFLEATTVKGLTGEETVEPKFWIADVEVPFTLRGLHTEDMYVLSPDEQLAEGIYAFATQGILIETDPGSLDKIPEEQRTVFPFEVK